MTAARAGRHGRRRRAGPRSPGRTTTGYATSVIGCDAEAGDRARRCRPTRRPTAGPASACCSSPSAATRWRRPLVNRVGQCVLTCPTTACYNGLPVGEKTINVGGSLRYFGDGWQISKRLDGRRYWRIPVMDGEFTLRGHVRHGQGRRRRQLPDPRRRARPRRSRRPRRPSPRCAQVPGVILPFPGGIVALAAEGRQQVQGPARAPTTPTARRSAGRSTACCRRASTRSTRSSSTASTWRPSKRRRGPACGPRAARACGGSPPATTAASSARTTCVCMHFEVDVPPPKTNPVLSFLRVLGGLW